MLGDAGNKRALRILLECILVMEFFGGGGDSCINVQVQKGH